MSTGSAPWFHILGTALTVREDPDATGKQQALPTAEVLYGRTTVGIYFSTDWCNPCLTFTPLLTTFYCEGRHLGPDRKAFKVILVSRCRSEINTSNYFATMPWTAIAHADSMGPCGQDLMSWLGVTTIPALVILNGTGSVICGDAQHRLVGDPTGSLFPWGPASHCPRIPGWHPRSPSLGDTLLGPYRTLAK
jgi:thiol-disulfide isomerase/thioredoxin